MKNKVKPNKFEGGITLIALIISVIILVILAAITVKILYEGGIIETTTTAASEYKLSEYEEKVMQVVMHTIQINALQGKETMMTDISEALNVETTWVESVRNKTNTSITNNDTEIIVRTTDEYEVEVYYDNALDKYYVAGTGKINDGKAYPEIKTTYENGIITIATTINNENDGIGKVEVISAKNIDTIYSAASANSGWTGTYTANENGTYKIKVTTLKGVVKFAWVKISNTIDSYSVPKIEVTNGTLGDNNWYKSSSVTVQIKATNTGTTINYILSGATEKEETNTGASNTNITISNQGLTKIIAWEEDNVGNTSKYTYFNVKIDTSLPTANINWSGRQKVLKTLASGKTWTESIVEKDSDNWYIENVEIELVGSDSSSGVEGYYYTITDLTTGVKSYNNEYVMGSTRKIIIATDGKYKIDVTVKDKAGNVNNISSFEIKKDTSGPEGFIPKITNETSNGFTISASAVDVLSGISYYDYFVDGECVAGGTLAKSMTVINKAESTTYEVYVAAYDNAGNCKIGTVLTAQTNATAATSTENIANEPKMTDGMIPVKYDNNKGEWVICSPTDPEWYSYTKSEKKWANIMLSDGKYTTYTAYPGAVVKEEELRINVCMAT